MGPGGRGGLESCDSCPFKQTHHEQPRKLTADAVCASAGGAGRRWPGPLASASAASALCAAVCYQWPPDPICHPHRGTAGTALLAEPSGMNGSRGRPPGVLCSPACMQTGKLPRGHRPYGNSRYSSAGKSARRAAYLRMHHAKTTPSGIVREHHQAFCVHCNQ